MRKSQTATPWSNERGSTLILVVLLTLILSASAIVAMRNVARTTQEVGVYRTRAQAQLTSDAANRLFGDYVGNKAPNFVSAMQNSLSGSAGVDDGVWGATGTATPNEATRQKLATVGAELEFSHTELQTDLLPGYGDVGESGLFQLAPGQETFETRRRARWRVRLRDMSDGFPAVGYSEGFCFKKATIGAEALVGTMDARWNRANNVAQARHGTDVLIGPIECGYN